MRALRIADARDDPPAARYALAAGEAEETEIGYC